MDKIRLFDRNLREKKLPSQPDQPGGNLFWAETKLLAEKNSLKPDFFFFLHSVIFACLTETILFFYIIYTYHVRRK